MENLNFELLKSLVFDQNHQALIYSIILFIHNCVCRFKAKQIKCAQQMKKKGKKWQKVAGCNLMFMGLLSAQMSPIPAAAGHVGWFMFMDRC